MSQFQNAQVRDLVWVMAAPNLLPDADWIISDSECSAMLTQAMPQLLALDRQPDHLQAWISARTPRRLGPYFEMLVSYWLTFLIDTTWFVTNTIVKSGRITIGEYDMLWRAPSGSLNHWEVSAKLYLQAGRMDEFASYVGTMTRDRLDLKVARLRDKQLQLARTIAGSAALPDIDEPVIAKALFKGWLFYPSHLPLTSAAGLSTRHLTGWWMRWGAAEFRLQPKIKWRVLERLSWLSPVRSSDATMLSTEVDFIASLTVHFTESTEPLLVAGLAQMDSAWEEVTRGFIVPQNW
ncbi:MAG: DUF1853 family protein [Sulfuriferula sp.]